MLGHIWIGQNSPEARRTVAYDSRHADDPVRLHALQRVEQRCGSDQFEDLVDSPATLLFDLSSDVAIIDDHTSGASVFQQLRSRVVSASRDHCRAMIDSNSRRSQSNARCATPNEQRLVFLQLQSFEERAICSLKHLSTSSEDFPWQLRLQLLDLFRWYARILGLPRYQLIVCAGVLWIAHDLHSLHRTPCPSHP